MNFIDFILNVVGLLLWLNWRAIYLSPVARPGSSLVATLKAAYSGRPQWLYFGILMALLLVRALFYWQIGPSLPWTPRISLGCTTLVFGTDLLSRMVFYSLMSFAAALGILYLWMLLLSCINSNIWEDNPQKKMIQLHLGFLKNWPTMLKLLLPLIATLLFWVLLHPVLLQMKMVPKCSAWHLMEQGAIIGLLVYLHAKYLLVGILLLHILNSYLFVGDFSFWTFIDLTAANLLRPLRQTWLPLVVKKIDLSPFIAVALILEIFALLAWASKSSWAVKYFMKLAS